MKISKTVLVFFLIFPMISWFRGVHAAESQNLTKECHDFVQSFYDWYVAKAMKDKKMSASDFALKYRGSSFTPELMRQLKEDSEASAKVSYEIVGLDFDPILNTQEPGERYVVGAVTLKGETYWAEVFGILSGKKSQRPDVVPELAFRDGHWVFVNFHYGKTTIPENENLLSVLKVLRDDRAKRGK